MYVHTIHGFVFQCVIVIIFSRLHSTNNALAKFQWSILVLIELRRAIMHSHSRTSRRRRT